MLRNLINLLYYLSGNDQSNYIHAIPDSSTSTNNILTQINRTPLNPPPQPTLNLYDILNISSDASESDIKKAFHKLALRYHPDKSGGQFNDEFLKIHHAYYILVDPERRRLYDSGVSSDVIPDNNHNSRSNYQTWFEETTGLSLDNLTDSRCEHLLKRKYEKSHVIPMTGNIPDFLNIKLKTGREYYLVGHPVLITENNKFRPEIPTAEITHSFPSQGTVMLFDELNSAEEYATATQLGDYANKIDCKKSAIAHVTLKENPGNFVTKGHHLFIRDDTSNRIDPKYLGRICEATIFYIEIDIHLLSLNSATLYIETGMGDNKNYPTIPFPKESSITTESTLTQRLSSTM